MNLNVEDFFVDLGRVRSRKARLLADERRHDALEQDLGVDDGDAAEGRLGGVLPVVVADDEHLDRGARDGHFKQSTRLLLVRVVGVDEQRVEVDVDGVDARVDQRDDGVVVRNVGVVVDVGLVRDVHVEGRLVGDEVVGDVGLLLLVLEEQAARVGHGGLEALNVLNAAVQGVVRRLDHDDLARAALAGALFVLGRDLDLAESKCVDLGQAVGKGLLHFFQALLIHPVVERVAGHEVRGDVVAARSLFHVVGDFFERVELDHRTILRRVVDLGQPGCAHSLLVLLVRSSAPSCCKRSDDGEAGGDLLVSAVGLAFERNGVVVDGKELGVLHVVDAGSVAWAGFGFEVEH